MPTSSLGEQELALLRYLADHGPATVGEVADAFGGERELARSTILTMMERLRKKDRLSRRLVGGVYQYRTRETSGELLRSVVARFVDDRLSGSVSPFTAYLADAKDLSDADLRELSDVVEKLTAARKRRKGAR
jgi:predicted transcriptional regulator